jgi:hypothetical protein
LLSMRTGPTHSQRKPHPSRQPGSPLTPGRTKQLIARLLAVNCHLEQADCAEPAEQARTWTPPFQCDLQPQCTKCRTQWCCASSTNSTHFTSNGGRARANAASVLTSRVFLTSLCSCHFCTLSTLLSPRLTFTSLRFPLLYVSTSIHFSSLSTSLLCPLLCSLQFFLSELLYSSLFTLFTSSLFTSLASFSSTSCASLLYSSLPYSLHVPTFHTSLHFNFHTFQTSLFVTFPLSSFPYLSDFFPLRLSTFSASLLSQN